MFNKYKTLLLNYLMLELALVLGLAVIYFNSNIPLRFIFDVFAIGSLMSMLAIALLTILLLLEE